ncbi:MAG: hypothetical protein C0621_02210 [Desulfuromonas sp.]|nr:MAG: hypothetical protein C0621_02210 [Desulfuromonas sp.]
MLTEQDDNPIGWTRFIIGLLILMSPSFFCFWLSDWHRHIEVLRHGETTIAHVVDMRETWGTMPNTSAQEAYKSYYLWLDYTDRDGVERFTVWDASEELFMRMQIGFPLPIRYLPGEEHGIIPEGETFQAFTDSGTYGLAGIGGLILLGPVLFLAFALLKNGRVRGL